MSIKMQCVSLRRWKNIPHTATTSLLISGVEFEGGGIPWLFSLNPCNSSYILFRVNFYYFLDLALKVVSFPMIISNMLYFC